MNKKLIIIFSLIFLLLMITNVSAKDTNTTDEVYASDFMHRNLRININFF